MYSETKLKVLCDINLSSKYICPLHSVFIIDKLICFYAMFAVSIMVPVDFSSVYAIPVTLSVVRHVSSVSTITTRNN